VGPKHPRSKVISGVGVAQVAIVDP
jgi:hypothetical protein